MNPHPFKKKPFDPSLVENYNEGFDVPKIRQRKLITRSDHHRNLVGLAIAIRPRSTKEIMRLTKIKHSGNAIRSLLKVGAVRLPLVNGQRYWAAPSYKGGPVDPALEKYDDWLMGKIEWPEEFGPLHGEETQEGEEE
jgi:hypothetical protein